jgi:starch synthase
MFTWPCRTTAPYSRTALAPYLKKEQRILADVMPDDRIHLAEDRAFFYLNRVYSSYGGRRTPVSALAFQREVINNIVPRVRPDLIHCNDWMTGLIPAMAREMGIPCLFTVHNIHTVKTAAGPYRGPRHRCRLFLAPSLLQ